MLIYLIKKVLFILFISVVFLLVLELVPYQRYSVYDYLTHEYESMLFYYGHDIEDALVEIKNYVVERKYLFKYLLKTHSDDFFMIIALRFYGLLKAMYLDYICTFLLGLLIGITIKAHYFNRYQDFFNLRIILNNLRYFVSSFFVVMFFQMQIVCAIALSITIFVWMVLLGIRLSFVLR